MPSENQSSRRLAAILFADIQGYTAMMQSDEGQAMNKLRHYQTVLKKGVKKFSGEIIKNYGDGSICLFSSVLNAVQCAKTLQEAFRIEPVIPLRIGLHLGDVMYEENDIYGNDINIASRIESMGTAGSILMSKNIHQKVKNQPDFQFTSLGTYAFKNVEEPLEVLALANEGLTIPSGDLVKGTKLDSKSKIKPIHIGIAIAVLMVLAYLFYNANDSSNSAAQEVSEKSIAVIPFVDLSPNKDQEYFSDGMMDEILNHLVKIEGLQVASRTSSMTYKGSSKKVAEIAQELGVANILEGSVRKAGDIVRITVQFIDGHTDKHIWSETYDGDLSNVFAMQSDIAMRIANALEAQITPDVRERINRIPTHNMVAYAKYLEGISISNFDRANQLFEEAIALDPEFGEAYIQSAEIKLFQIIFTRSALVENTDTYLAEIDSLLDKGLSLSPNCAKGYINKGAINVWFNWDFEAAESNYKKAQRLNPSENTAAYTEFLLSQGRFEEALQNSSKIVAANPGSGFTWIQHALVYHFLNEPQKAEEAIDFVKSGWGTDTIDASNYLRLLVFEKKYEDFISIYENLSLTPWGINPRTLGLAGVAYHHMGNEEAVQGILDTLANQSKISPIGSPAFYSAMVYAQLGQFDQAFQWLERAYEDREVEMYWLKVEPPFQPLYDDPRWSEMIRKVGFDTKVKG